MRGNGTGRGRAKAIKHSVVRYGGGAGRRKQQIDLPRGDDKRIKARRGSKRAAIAVGRSILEIAYHILRDGVAYQELGANYYDERKKNAVVRGAIKRLERLGYRVAVEPAA